MYIEVKKGVGKMAKNEFKKLTFEDKFARKFFSDRRKKAIKKQERILNNKIMRRHNKNLIEKNLEE